MIETSYQVDAGLPSRYRGLLFAAVAVTSLLIATGGVVCVTESGRGCPDWPWCYGRALPPPRTDSVIEYTHRAVAGLASLLIMASAGIGWRRYRSVPQVVRPLWLAVGCLSVVIAFGAAAVLRGLTPSLAAVDLGLALLTLALVTVAWIATLPRHDPPALSDSDTGTPDRSMTRWVFAMNTAVWIVLATSVLVEDSGTVLRCLGWPLYTGYDLPADSGGWLRMARHAVAGVATVLIVTVAVMTWRKPKISPELRSLSAIVVTIFLIEASIGVVLSVQGFSISLLVARVVMADLLWVSVVALLAKSLRFCPEPAPNRTDCS